MIAAASTAQGTKKIPNQNPIGNDVNQQSGVYSGEDEYSRNGAIVFFLIELSWYQPRVHEGGQLPSTVIMYQLEIEGIFTDSVRLEIVLSSFELIADIPWNTYPYSGVIGTNVLNKV